MLIRPATTADAEAIMAIYNVEVLETTHTFDLVPRTLDEQVAYIRERSGALAVMVAEEEVDAARSNAARSNAAQSTNTRSTSTRSTSTVVTGFGSLSLYRDRPGYRTTVENSVYVHRDHRGKGVGHALMADLIERARNHGFHAMFARIADAQEASMNLHEQHGFELVGIEREVGRKFGKFRDVAVMQLILS